MEKFVVQKYLKKFKSQLIVNPSFLAIQHASLQISAALSDNAGVIPVKWNQSASAKASAQKKSVRSASAIDDPALS